LRQARSNVKGGLLPFRAYPAIGPALLTGKQEIHEEGILNWEAPVLIIPSFHVFHDFMISRQKFCDPWTRLG
jgi:hypothetical protein